MKIEKIKHHQFFNLTLMNLFTFCITFFPAKYFLKILKLYLF